MNEILTTRLPKESLELMEKLADDEHTDKASLARKMLLEHIDEYMMQKATEMYRRGEISLEEAAVRANTSLWKMIDYVKRNNISPPEESLEALERSLEKARTLFKKRAKKASVSH